MDLESSEVRWALGLVYLSDVVKDLVLSFFPLCLVQCQLYPQAGILSWLWKAVSNSGALSRTSEERELLDQECAAVRSLCSPLWT